MPIEPRLQVGNMRGFKKRIIEVEAEFYETQNAAINTIEVPFRAFDSAVLDTAVAEFTGLKRVGPLLGYDYEGSVTVTQTQRAKRVGATYCKRWNRGGVVCKPYRSKGLASTGKENTAAGQYNV